MPPLVLTESIMPATAGRVRMPHNNRVSSSSALKTNDMWSKTIGYDPYAVDEGGAGGAADEGENAYEQAQGLMAIAKLSNQGVTEARGACKSCGMVGHLTFQCRNHLQGQVWDGKGKPPEGVAGGGDSGGESDIDVSDVSDSDDDDDEDRKPSKKGRGFAGEDAGGGKLGKEGKVSSSKRKKRSRSHSSSSSSSDERRKHKKRKKSDRHERKSKKSRKSSSSSSKKHRSRDKDRKDRRE